MAAWATGSRAAGGVSVGRSCRGCGSVRAIIGREGDMGRFTRALAVWVCGVLAPGLPASAAASVGAPSPEVIVTQLSHTEAGNAAMCFSRAIIKTVKPILLNDTGEVKMSACEHNVESLGTNAATREAAAALIAASVSTQPQPAPAPQPAPQPEPAADRDEVECVGTPARNAAVITGAIRNAIRGICTDEAAYREADRAMNWYIPQVCPHWQAEVAALIPVDRLVQGRAVPSTCHQQRREEGSTRVRERRVFYRCSQASVQRLAMVRSGRPVFPPDRTRF